MLKRAYRGLHGVTRVYRGLQGVTRGYRGYKELQGVTRGYRKLQGVTKGYMGLQGVTVGSTNKESIRLYNMLQQVTLKGLQIPHSGFRIPESRFVPSTNPTKTWRTVSSRSTVFYPFFVGLKP